MSDDYFSDDDLQAYSKLTSDDPQVLQSTEEDIVTKSTAQLLQEKSPKNFNFEYLLHVHRVLFKDVYSFAGQIRTVDIAKPDSRAPFARAAYIVSEAERIFTKLAANQYLVGLSHEAFVTKIVDLATDLNALHPFREGNGRTLRLFLILLSDHAGYLLDYSQVTATELIEADKRAFEGDESLLTEVYKKVAIPIV